MTEFNPTSSAYPKDKPHLNPNRGDPNHSTSTAMEADIKCLWKLGRKANSFYLSMRLMEDMVMEEIGTNEVKSLEWRRRQSREAKKGKASAPVKGRSRMTVLLEDRKRVRTQMKLRAKEAKEDWQEA